MDLLKVRPGEAALYDGRLVVIKQVDITTMHAWCDYVDTGEQVRVPFAHLNALRHKSRASSSISKFSDPDLAEIPPERLRNARRKKEMILKVEINDNPALTSTDKKQSVRQLAQSFGVHPSTIYWYINTYNHNGREERYLVEKVRGGKDRKRIAPEAEKAIEQAIDQIYLTLGSKSKSATYEEVERLCYRNNIKPVPSYDTVCRRINALADGTIVRRREGKKRYRELYHVSNGSVCDEDDIPYPLHTVEIDSTLVDVILVDEHFRQPLGRPYLTLAVDVYSRVVMGFHLSFDPVSADSVAQCIAHAVCPKESWLEQLGVEGQWPCWGIPDRFRVDKGHEFKNDAYQVACNNYDIRIVWRNKVEDGAVVERLIGTSMRSVHSLPGTTQSNVQEKGDYDAEGKATLTLKAFERWFTWWIINYNNKVHTGIDMSPLFKYIQAFAPREGGPARRPIPDYLTNRLALRLDFAPYELRTIQRKGVVYEHIWYYDPLLKWLHHQNRNRQYVFRRLPENVGSIWLRDPTTGEYAEIKYANVNRLPVSVWELRAAKKRLKDGNIAPDEETLFKAVESMRTIVQQELTKRKTTRLTVNTNRIIDLLNPTSPRETSDPLTRSTTSVAYKLELTTPLLSDDDEVKPFGFLTP